MKPARLTSPRSGSAPASRSISLARAWRSRSTRLGSAATWMAPITMVQFSDFECPHCRQAYATVNSVLRRYEGKVTLAFRDFPLIQAEASGLGADAASLVGSADAARCAQEQGKFWEYHDVLFESEGRSEYDFREYANQLGLDVEPFSTCLTSGRYAEAIKADFADGLSLGIGGTPYFLHGVCCMNTLWGWGGLARTSPDAVLPVAPAAGGGPLNGRLAGSYRPNIP